MTSRLRAFASVRAVVAGIGLSLAAGWALADGGGGANCCYTKTCGSESATHCLGYDCSTLGPNYKCSGVGGCDPVWAEARCVLIQPGGPH